MSRFAKMTVILFEHFGRALVLALAVFGHLTLCENAKGGVVEDQSDRKSSQDAKKVSEISPHVMTKLKNSMEMTDSLLNGMLGDLLVSSRRDKEDGAVETIHSSGKDVMDHVESKALMISDRSESDDLFDAAKKLLDSTQKNKHVAAYEILERASNLGHNQSKLEIAWKVLLGDFDGDLDGAKKIFLDLAEIGEPEAHTGLGFLHAAGITEMGNQARALIHYMLGALGGNVWAQIVLGYRYKTGTSVTRNCEKSLTFYEKAAKNVVQRMPLSGGNIVHRIRLVDLEENVNHNSYWLEADLIQYYEYLAMKGDVNAQITLGQLYFHGLRGCPKDLRKAKYYFGLASKRDHPTAWGYLGRIFLEDTEVEKTDNSSALNFFNLAAEQNNPIGLTGLGMMYLEGRGVEMDLKKAKTYFSRAADLGWMEGQLQLGVMYLNGVGVKQNFRSALKYFHLAAQSGHILAYYYLAEMHAAGYGILRSCPIAVELYKSVAERGKWSEYLVSGYNKFQAGKYFHAFVVYALLAELGYEVAQSNAAYMLEKGLSGLTISDKERYFRAFNYWRRSAQQGYSQAYVKMGDYYYYGTGVLQDFEAAAIQYRLASGEFGNPQALYNLAFMHEHGLGMPRDLALAKRFYDLAATVSPDAHLPVYLSLTKLAAVVFLEYVTSETLKLFADLTKQWRSGLWDVYILFSLIASLLFLLTRRA